MGLTIKYINLLTNIFIFISTIFFSTNSDLIEANRTTIDTSLPNTSNNNHSILSQETLLNVSDASTVDGNETDNM